MVHTGRELLSEAGYFHSFSMENDPLEMKEILDSCGVLPSALSAHCPLMRPEISVPYLQKAICFAASIGAPVVCTDEGIRPGGMNDDECFQIMKYTLASAVPFAERRGDLHRDRTTPEYFLYHKGSAEDCRVGGLSFYTSQLRHRECLFRR